jgi:hypothetical protein
MTENNYVRDIAKAYEALNPLGINDEYLEHLVTIFGEIAERRPPPSAKARHAFLKASVAGLTALTDAVHPALRRQPSITSCFSTKHPAGMLLDDQALAALAAPFKEAASELEWLSNPIDDSPLRGMAPPSYPAYQSDLRAEPSWSDYAHLDEVHAARSFDRDKRDINKENERIKREAHRRYERELAEWKKESALLYKNASPEQRVLAGTPLYHFAHELKPTGTIELPFNIPEDRWFEGCWIVAPQGSGKTNLLRHLILDRLKSDATVIVMDAKGNLLDSLKYLKNLKDRLILLEPSAEHPLAVNPFATGSGEMLEYLFGVFSAEIPRALTHVLREGLLQFELPAASVRARLAHPPDHRPPNSRPYLLRIRAQRRYAANARQRQAYPHRQ